MRGAAVDWRRAALQSIDGRVQSTYVARVLISMGFTEAEGRLRWILVPSVLQSARSKNKEQACSVKKKASLAPER